MTGTFFLKRVLPLYRARQAARRGDNSFAGEFAHLTRLLGELGIESGYVVDIAAHDGVSQSSTYGLFADPAWSGLAVEMDPDRFAILAFIYSQFEHAKLTRCRVTPGNVQSLLEGNEVPKDFTVLNFDIDSYDLFVVENMLKAGFRPKIISMEVNEKIPPPVFFTVNFDEDHYWKGDHFYGCSLAAAAHVVKPRGYKLESLQYNNAIFVRDDVGARLIQDQTVEAAYDAGYRNRADRKSLFPYNSDVERALTQTADDNVVFFGEFFKKYRGKFTLAARQPPEAGDA